MLGDTIVLVGNSSKSGIGNEIGWDLHLPQNPKHIHDAHLTSLRQLQISTMLGTCGSLQSKAYTINSIVSNTCHWVKLAQSMQCTSFDMWASRPYEFHWSTKWPHTPPLPFAHTHFIMTHENLCALIGKIQIMNSTIGNTSSEPSISKDQNVMRSSKCPQ